MASLDTVAPEPTLQPASHQRVWVALAALLVVVALVIAYLAVQPVVNWISDQLHSHDIDV